MSDRSQARTIRGALDDVLRRPVSGRTALSRTAHTPRAAGGDRIRVSKRILAVFVFAGALVALSAFVGGNARAYGTTHVYEITFSFNCQNQALCQASESNPFGIGGFWGWVELDAGGTGDGQAESQGHDNANPALNGSGHVTFPDLSWTTFTTLDGSVFLSISAPAELGPQPLVFPAGSGHYVQKPAPGISNEITITLLP